MHSCSVLGVSRRLAEVHDVVARKLGTCGRIRCSPGPRVPTTLTDSGSLSVLFGERRVRRIGVRFSFARRTRATRQSVDVPAQT